MTPPCFIYCLASNRDVLFKYHRAVVLYDKQLYQLEVCLPYTDADYWTDLPASLKSEHNVEL